MPSLFSISIVIPVLNAEQYIPRLMDAFALQSVQPAEIILVDSGSTDGTKECAARYSNVRVIPLNNFTHGKSRNVGAKEAVGDLVVFLSQDAVPSGNEWLSNLIAVFDEEKVAAAYSRQVPWDDASPMEQFFLHKRFPEISEVRKRNDADEVMTLESVFFSNVSSCVRRKLLLKFPFDEELIMSEDQQLSLDLIIAGYSVCYVAESVVTHSHCYSLSLAFRRYFDSVYSLTKIFSDHDVGTSVKIGRKYVKDELSFIFRKHPLWLPYYFLYTLVKATATIMAHHADRLPKWMLKKLSLHNYYWNTETGK